MKVDRLILGDFETNCYVLRKSHEATQCLIIDAGLNAEPLIHFLKENNLTPIAVIFTHGHVDHIAGTILLRSDYPGIKLCIHKLDAKMLTSPWANISLLAGLHFKTTPAEVIIDHEQTIEFAGITLQVLHTPGHTPGSISLYSFDDGLVFVGDALFAGSVGRTDFPGSSHRQLIASINEKLLSLPDQTVVYPGHGPSTTIINEKNTNPFLR